MAQPNTPTAMAISPANLDRDIARKNAAKLADSTRVAECRNSVTSWQSSDDLQYRRMMMRRLMVLMRHRNGLTVAEDTWMEKLPSLVRRVELSLYIRAASLEEYINPRTLKRRVQCLVLTLHRQGMNGSSSPSSSSEGSSTPTGKRSPDSRDDDACSSSSTGRKRQRTSEYRRDSMEMSYYDNLPVEISSSSSDVFLGNREDLISHIFEYLDTKDIFKMTSLTRAASIFLPSCVRKLRADHMTLGRLLEHPNVCGGQLSRYQNLTHLEVYNTAHKDQAATSHSFLASGCPQLPFHCNNNAETVIRDLAVGIMAGCWPKLQVLALPSLFVNTNKDNGIASIVVALKTGKCPNLQYLSLGGNSISDMGAIEVADLLISGTCPDLKVLDLRRNFIGESGGAAIAGALSARVYPSLEVLSLGGNIFTDATAECFATLLCASTLPSLNFLGLDQNFLETKGVLKIVAAATLSETSMKKVHLEENAVSKQTLKDLINCSADQEIFPPASQ